MSDHADEKALDEYEERMPKLSDKFSVLLSLIAEKMNAFSSPQ